MNLLLSVVGLALAALRENKMRSFLTVLGVIIGTGTIIGVGSILAGLDNAVAGVVRSIGASTAIVFKMRLGPSVGGRTPEEINRKPLTYEDAVALAERCPSVEHVSPYLLVQVNFRGPSQDHARYKSNDAYQLQVAGTDENYVNSGQAEIDTGRFFTATEDVHRLPVVVLGQDVYGSLFGAEQAEGKKITVDGQEVTVLGVMKRPASSVPGQTDNRLLMPYFTAAETVSASPRTSVICDAKRRATSRGDRRNHRRAAPAASRGAQGAR